MNGAVAESERAATSTRGTWTAACLAERRSVGRSGDRKGSVAADQSNGVSQNGIARTRGFGQRGKEEEIRGWTERRKHKWAARNKGQQREQPDGDEAIDADVDGPYQAQRKVVQQPLQSQVRKEHADVLEVAVLGAWRSSDIRKEIEVFVVFILSAFPRPRVFSDSMNSIRSIHLTIL